MRVALLSVQIAFCTLVALSPPLTARAQDAVPPAPTLTELVGRLDVDPDPLHADFTPAVWALCEHGLEGANAVLDALESDDAMTRMHASRVLSCAVSRHFDWRPGRGYADGAAGEDRFRVLWRDDGSYEHDASAAARASSVSAWRAWLSAHLHDPPPPPTRPSSEEVRSALERPLAAARACVRTTTPVRISVDLTFVSSGDMSAGGVHGARGAPARCIEHSSAPHAWAASRTLLSRSRSR